MKQKILLLTINFPPNPSVGTHRVAKILKYIDMQRFEFHVLTLKEKYYNTSSGLKSGDMDKIPSSVQVYRTDRSDLTSIFTRIKASLLRLKTRSSAKAPQSVNTQKQRPPSGAHSQHWIYNVRNFIFSMVEFPDKYIGWAFTAIREGVRIVKREQIDIIMTTAPPHSLFIMATIIKKLTKARLVLDFRDPWALSRWDSGNAFGTKVERWLEKWTLKHADLCLFVTQNLKEEYSRVYRSCNGHKFKLFSNGYDPDDFKHTSVETSAPSTPFRLVHLGTLYKKRDPWPLIQAVTQLLKNGQLRPEEFQIELIGRIATELSAIPGRAQELGADRVVKFLPPVSFQESITTMFRAGGLLLLQPGTDLQVPAKLFEYMYTQKPILAIAEPGSATERIIQKGELGVVAPSTDVDKIEKAILQLLSRAKTKHHPRKEYIQSFNFKSYIGELESYLGKLARED